jgi:alpha-L-fucosidase
MKQVSQNLPHRRMFKTEYLDTAKWGELFQNSEANFDGPCAEHHDGFAIWVIEINLWNVTGMGSKKNIAGELLAELKKRGMKTITTLHHVFDNAQDKPIKSIKVLGSQVECQWKTEVNNLFLTTTDAKFINDIAPVFEIKF